MSTANRTARQRYGKETRAEARQDVLLILRRRDTKIYGVTRQAIADETGWNRVVVHDVMHALLTGRVVVREPGTQPGSWLYRLREYPVMKRDGERSGRA